VGHSLGMKLRATSSVIEIKSTALLPRAD